MTAAAIDTAPKFDSWAILELMGHKKLAGKVTEEVVAGAALLRVDVPETSHRPSYTKYFSTSALYCITPCEEELARRAAEQIERHTDPIPVYLPEPAKQIAAQSTVPADVEEDPHPSWDDDDDGDGDYDYAADDMAFDADRELRGRR